MQEKDQRPADLLELLAAAGFTIWTDNTNMGTDPMEVPPEKFGGFIADLLLHPNGEANLRATRIP